jgi:hypothetical protein
MPKTWLEKTAGPLHRRHRQASSKQAIRMAMRRFRLLEASIRDLDRQLASRREGPGLAN